MSAIATQAPSAPRTYPATTMAAPPTASGTRGALMPLRSSSRLVSSHRPTTTATAMTPTNTALTTNSDATITAPSPTPTPMAARRSRPALFFCGAGAGCEASGMGSGFCGAAPWDGACCVS